MMRRAQGSEQRAKSTEYRSQSKEHRAQSTGQRAQADQLTIQIKIKMDDFRFEQLDIWKESIEVSDILFDFADKADDKRFYKFAEQLRAAAMSISNNIAEGSGSFSDKDFASFLNIARRSVFECANILVIYERRKIIMSDDRTKMKMSLLLLSKKITSFRKTLI